MFNPLNLLLHLTKNLFLHVAPSLKLHIAWKKMLATCHMSQDFQSCIYHVTRFWKLHIAYSSSICCLDSIAQAQGTRSCLHSHVMNQYIPSLIREVEIIIKCITKLHSQIYTSHRSSLVYIIR
jgi:hypothetical protein